MRVFELLSKLAGRLRSGADGEPIPEESIEIAARARGESVTPGVLANRDGRSDQAIVTYLADDEQPEYVLRGNRLLISDGDSCETKYPSRDTQVVISDRRVLILLGGRLSDDLWEMPLEDVRYAYVDNESWKRYLIVEANRDDQRMTFYVDATVESNVDDLRAAAAYVRDRSG